MKKFSQEMPNVEMGVSVVPLATGIQVPIRVHLYTLEIWDIHLQTIKSFFQSMHPAHTRIYAPVQ